MLILFLVSLIGHALVHRTMTIIARDFAFSQHLVRNLLLANLVTISFITFSTGSSDAVWLFIGILLISLKFIPSILRIFLLKRLRQALIPFLDVVIMGLQTGKSFRSSLFAAIENESGWVRYQLMELYQSLHMSENVISMKTALLKDLQKEFAEIDRSKSRCVEQVRALRRELKTLENFRRRSGQITQQIKMQALIVTALYLGLLFFVITQFGFIEHRFLIFSASGTFLMGLIWIFITGRRLKWKV